MSLTLTLAGVYFFLKYLANYKYIFLSGIFFAFTLLTYQGSKFGTLIVLIVLAWTFRKRVLKLFKHDYFVVSQSFFLSLLIILPVIFSLTGVRAGRLEVFSLFSYTRSEEYVSRILSQGDEFKNSLSYFLYHSENLNFLKTILNHFFNHFSGRFLFFEGDWQNPRHSLPNSGMLLLVDLILLPIGREISIR